MRNVVETAFNGLAIMLLGKELIDAHNSDSHWKEKYESVYNELQVEKAAGAQNQMRVLEDHNVFMSFMQQIQEQEGRLQALEQALGRMATQVMAHGFAVDDDYNITPPEAPPVRKARNK